MYQIKMITSQNKGKVAILLVMSFLIIAGFIPFKKRLCGNVVIHVVDKSGKPVNLFPVKQIWDSTEYSNPPREKTTRVIYTDVNGTAVFPSVSIRVSFFKKVYVISREILKSGVHFGISGFVDFEFLKDGISICCAHDDLDCYWRENIEWNLVLNECYQKGKCYYACKGKQCEFKVMK